MIQSVHNSEDGESIPVDVILFVSVIGHNSYIAAYELGWVMR